MKVVVVGAGVMGASVAYHLRLAGIDVVVVDHGHEGRATSAGAGIVCPWSARFERPDWYRLASGGARYYPELLQRLAEDGQTDVGYKRVGALVASDDPALLDADEKRLRGRRDAAPEMGQISRLAPAEARALFPPLSESCSALHIAGAARLDGRRLAAAMLAAAQRRGAAFQAGLARLVRRGDKIVGVATPEGAIEADMVVLAGGAWAAPMLSEWGLALAIEPQRGQILHLRLPRVETSRWPVVLPQSAHYILSFDDARVVAGATREDGSGLDYRITAGGLQELLDHALAVAPGLASASIIETRIGFRPMPADGKPLLGRTPGLDGLMIANGLGSSGLTIGPYAGRLIAEEMAGVLKAVDLSPYAPLRAA